MTEMGRMVVVPERRAASPLPTPFGQPIPRMTAEVPCLTKVPIDRLSLADQSLAWCQRDSSPASSTAIRSFLMGDVSPCQMYLLQGARYSASGEIEYRGIREMARSDTSGQIRPYF